jgi:hypothetical protein
MLSIYSGKDKFFSSGICGVISYTNKTTILICGNTGNGHSNPIRGKERLDKREKITKNRKKSAFISLLPL